MEPLASLSLATDEFRRRLGEVDPAEYDAPSSCTDWSVRDLVGHVIAGNSAAVLMLHGASVEEVVASFGPPPAGDDLPAVFGAGSEALLDAFAEEGALDRTCHHFMGDLPGRGVLGFRVSDLTLHAWDLAHSTGGDEDLPPELVREVWAVTEPLGPMMAGSGMFGEGPSGTVGDDRPLQDRLLDLTGRRP